MRNSVIAGVLLLLPLAGCAGLFGGSRVGEAGSPALTRQQKAYPDLHSGKFLSLSDFETAGQELLWRVAGLSGAPEPTEQPSITILRSRNETGAGGLKALLDGPEDRLILDGQRSATAALTRDWRGYFLLLFSVYGPDGGALLETVVRSGAESPLHWQRTTAVAPGWNLLRFDISEMAESIDLADVRAVELRIAEPTGRHELYVDDVLLADNTRWFTAAAPAVGALRICSRGRRLVVESPERFVLAFEDGVLVSWRAGATDADNLVDPRGLGPWPVPLPNDWRSQKADPIAPDDPALYRAWGEAVATSQQLREATPFRAIVRGEWRFGRGDSARSDDALPHHTWQYTIYPNGRVMVAAASSPGEHDWPAPLVGYALLLDGRRQFRRIEPPEASADGPRAPFVLFARADADQADLLWSVYPPSLMRRQRTLATADERRLAVVVGEAGAAPSVTCSSLLRIWPPDIDSAVEGGSFAADYGSPATLRVLAGRLVTDAPGDADNDGFNESEGCYELAADGGVLRFEFATGDQPRFDPIFRVRGVAGRTCWVYSRGRGLTDQGRDSDGELLFALPRMSAGTALVEMHSSAGS